jgi:two-component system, OmpR family, sensor histidine kinase VicK
VAYAFGIELPYSLLVPVAHLRLLGVVDSGVQARMLGMIGLMYVVKTAGLVALLVHMLRPIEHLRRYAVAHPLRSGAGVEELGGGAAPPEELILAAANAAYDTPLSFATVWAVSWALLYLPVTVALYYIAPDQRPLDVQRGVALALFALALFAAALPLAYSILGRLLSPAAGVISLIARERGLSVPGKGYSLAVRLGILGACRAFAPTSWMAAMVLGETASE